MGSSCFKKVKIISPKAQSCMSYCNLVKTGGYAIEGNEQLKARYSMNPEQTAKNLVKDGAYQASYLGDDNDEDVEEDAAEDEDIDPENEAAASASSFFLVLGLLI